MFRRKLFYFLFLYLLGNSYWNYAHKPGFDWLEYEKMLQISIQAFQPQENEEVLNALEYDWIFSSNEGPMANLFKVYRAKNQKNAVFSFRGTTDGAGSWMQNMYAAMIPATGSIELEKGKQMYYQFAENEDAALHAGWTMGFISLLPEIREQLDILIQDNIKDIYITGHSQGGALAHIMTAWLHYQEEYSNFSVKTYASASPKPGNYYFSTDYYDKTQNGYSFNVSNVMDWVPQSFLTTQNIEDIVKPNFFTYFKEQAEKEKFIKRIVNKFLYAKMNKVGAKAVKKYKKYSGEYMYKRMKEFFPHFVAPDFVFSFDYHDCGPQIKMTPPEEYFIEFKNASNEEFMYHHHADKYFWLVDYYKKRYSLEYNEE